MFCAEKCGNKNVGITDKKVSLVKSRQGVLQTVTMEELYDTVYLPKVPIVDGLLYNGMYVFVSVLKVGKSFLGTARIPCEQRNTFVGLFCQ